MKYKQKHAKNIIRILLVSVFFSVYIMYFKMMEKLVSENWEKKKEREEKKKKKKSEKKRITTNELLSAVRRED